MASCQSGSGGIVRIWRFETRKCCAIIRNQYASSMHVLAFSKTGAVLAGVGRLVYELFLRWNTIVCRCFRVPNRHNLGMYGNNF